MKENFSFFTTRKKNCEQKLNVGKSRFAFLTVKISKFFEKEKKKKVGKKEESESVPAKIARE